MDVKKLIIGFFQIIIFILIWLYLMFWIVGYSVVEKGIPIYGYSRDILIGGIVSILVSGLLIKSIKTQYLLHTFLSIFFICIGTILFFDWKIIVDLIFTENGEFNFSFLIVIYCSIMIAPGLVSLLMEYTSPIGNVDNTYKGDIKNGQANGLGKMYQNGRTVFTSEGDLIYEGEWKDGKKHGKGKKFYDGDLIYEGEWNEGCYHGKGKEFSDGDLIYEGEWKYSEEHGKGIKYFKVVGKNLAKYEGEFEESDFNGKGCLTLLDGTVYKGLWENNKFLGNE